MTAKDIQALLAEARELVSALDDKQWTVIAFENANEAMAYGHWPTELRPWFANEALMPADFWMAQGVAGLYARTSLGITGLPGSIYGRECDIRFMAFARRFIPAALAWFDEHLSDIEAIGKTAYGLNLQDPGNRLMLFAVDHGQQAGLLRHAYCKAEERRLSEKKRQMQSGCFDDSRKREDERWRERNEVLFRDANDRARLSQEAYDVVQLSKMFQTNGDK